MIPSKSTYASFGLGVPIATVAVWVASLFGVEMSVEVGSAIGALVAAAIGYFFLGGKAVDTED